MEINICQSCGGILRGQSSECKGCGVPLTRHSATAVAPMQGDVLSVDLRNEQFYLESAVNHAIYGSVSARKAYGLDANGNGANEAVVDVEDIERSVNEAIHGSGWTNSQDASFAESPATFRFNTKVWGPPRSTGGSAFGGLISSLVTPSLGQAPAKPAESKIAGIERQIAEMGAGLNANYQQSPAIQPSAPPTIFEPPAAKVDNGNGVDSDIGHVPLYAQAAAANSTNFAQSNHDFNDKIEQHDSAQDPLQIEEEDPPQIDAEAQEQYAELEEHKTNNEQYAESHQDLSESHTQDLATFNHDQLSESQDQPIPISNHTQLPESQAQQLPDAEKTFSEANDGFQPFILRRGHIGFTKQWDFLDNSALYTSAAAESELPGEIAQSNTDDLSSAVSKERGLTPSTTSAEELSSSVLPEDLSSSNSELVSSLANQLSQAKADNAPELPPHRELKAVAFSGPGPSPHVSPKESTAQQDPLQDPFFGPSQSASAEPDHSYDKKLSGNDMDFFAAPPVPAAGAVVCDDDPPLGEDPLATDPLTDPLHESSAVAEQKSGETAMDFKPPDAQSENASTNSNEATSADKISDAVLEKLSKKDKKKKKEEQPEEDSEKKTPKEHKRHDRFSHDNKPEVKIQLGGVSVSRNMLITVGVLCVVIGFPVTILISTLSSMVSPSSNPQQTASVPPGPGLQEMPQQQMPQQQMPQQQMPQQQMPQQQMPQQQMPQQQMPQQQMPQQQMPQQQMPQQAPQTTPNSLSGKWNILFESSPQRIGRGSFTVNQVGPNFQGWGLDDFGSFQLAGSVQGNTASFNKVYVNNGQPVGKPIQYMGTVSIPQQPAAGGTNEPAPLMLINGEWQVNKHEIYSGRTQVVTKTGRFQAQMFQFGAGAQQIANNPGSNLNPSSTPSNSFSSLDPANNGTTTSAPASDPSGQAKDPKKAQGFFMQVALGIVGIGAALAMVSLRFFGPSGLLNIWAKKEYIPSQFKSQHFKMVKEMGKPLRPGAIPLGTREEWGIHQFWLPKLLNLPIEEREKNPHLFMLGAGSTGKTRLMASMIVQDIESKDRAVVVVDSDGNLADLVLSWIASRPNASAIAKRVIVIDPTYPAEPICFNPLEFPEDGDLQNCASSLVFGFKAVYTEPPGSQSQWNQQTANILRNAAVLLMANGRTLTDLPVLLADNDFRDVLLENVEKMKQQKTEYITLIDAWTNYKRLARTDQWITWIEPILNRIQPMLSDPRLRRILTNPKSDLELQKIIDQKLVLIVKIPQGQLDKNGNLLGSLMVAGLKQAALSLSARNKGKKHPCSLYLDEFESFIEKETFDAITTETRKLQIGFCGASKSLQTLPEDFRNHIVINVGIMAIFALAKKDADMLGPQMFRVDGRKVKHQTIQNVFNKVNTSPQFELIMDEEKLNIDRVVGQEKQTYFCYRVGSVAGVFHMKAPNFPDIDESQVNKDIIEKMHKNREAAQNYSEDANESAEASDEDEDEDEEIEDEEIDEDDEENDDDSEDDDDEDENK